jgi:magnesium transporter
VITVFEQHQGAAQVRIVGAEEPLHPNAVWIDMLNASEQERQAIERALGVELPTSEEMQDIEVSSKLYLGKGALYMIAEIVMREEGTKPETSPVTFVLAREHLVTVRYVQTKPFAAFAQHVQRQGELIASAEVAFLALLEVIIGQVGQLARDIALQLDSVSRIIFWQTTNEEDKTIASRLGLRSALYGVGHAGEVVSRMQQSLMSVDRLLLFYAERSKHGPETPLASRTESMQRDVQSLVEHGEFLSQKVGFLLDATLGFINAEQNQIIKIFSIAAVILLPPTLVATVYGMNFDVMPELAWPLGYPLALALMVAAGILPYAYFKRRGWI